MRVLFLISLFFVYSVAAVKAQGKAELVKTVTELNEAMEQKDSIVLKKLLHERLGYGHSNGWIESKKELIEDLYNGKLSYKSIKQSAEQFEIVNTTATVRSMADIDVLLDGKPMSFKLHVLQVWVWEKKGWKLLGRQSVKM
jgi:hypothetical protein